MRNRTVRIAGTAILTVILGAAVVGCSSSKNDDNATAAENTTTVAPAGDQSTTLPQQQGNGQQSNGQSSNNNSGGANNNSGGGQTPSGPMPVIVSFNMPESIDCHNGMLQNFTASWTTQNATEVTIAIDGSGIYNTYGPNAETSLPFNCASAHTFKLTANGPGGSVHHTVTLQPRNVPGTGGGEEEEE